jgi:cell division protein FtsA
VREVRVLARNNYIYSLDIGTAKIRVIIGEHTNGSINIVGVGTTDTQGMSKGKIVNHEQVARSIQQAVQNAERMVDASINSVYLAINGSHIGLQTSKRGYGFGKDTEISDSEIDKVMKVARLVNVPSDREIIDIIPVQYIVDGIDNIQDPRGMIGGSLEVDATLITGSTTQIQNLIGCVKRANLKILGLVLAPMGVAELALTEDEKQMGTVSVEIGAGTTSIAIFKNGRLLSNSVLPIGGELVTNDISIMLDVDRETAEKLKLKFGVALAEDAEQDQVFRIKTRVDNREQETTQVQLAEIIEPRIEQILLFIQKELREQEFDTEGFGFVFTGGTVLLPGFVKLSQYVLGTPVRIAAPQYIGVKDASFTTSVGVISYAAKYNRTRKVDTSVSTPKTFPLDKPSTTQDNMKQKPNVFDRIVEWFREIFD